MLISFIEKYSGAEIHISSFKGFLLTGLSWKGTEEKFDSRKIQPKSYRGRSSPKLGGTICRVGAKNVVKNKRAEGVQKFLGLIQEKFSGLFN